MVDSFRHSLRALAIFVSLSILAPAATAADELILYRRTTDGAITFFVRGARPGETVVLLATVESAQDSVSAALGADVADATGGAYLVLDDVAWLQQTQAVSVKAVVERVSSAGREVVGSNSILLRDPPLLWMVVERDNSTTRVLRFDFEQETLEEARRGRQHRDGLLAVHGNGAIVREDAALVALERGDTVGFARGEEPIDLALTPDQSAFIALTRESVGDGATLLRVRMLDAARLGSELSSCEVGRSTSRVVSAWLVADDDSHRVLVAERDGLVQELIFGSSMTRGITLLPLADGGREELVDCVVDGDWLVGTTRFLGGRPGGRLFVVDLARRDRVVEHALAGRPLEVVVVRDASGPAACIALEGGSLERVALVDGVRSRLALAGVAQLAVAADGRSLFASADSPSGETTAIYAIDPSFSAAIPIKPFASLARSVQQLGVVASGDREWLFVVERRFAASKPGTASVDDHLGWIEIDPRDGAVKGAARFFALGGRVSGLAAR